MERSPLPFPPEYNQLHLENKEDLKKKHFFVVVANLQSESASAIGDDEDRGVARVESRDRQLVKVVRVPWVSIFILLVIDD